MRSPHGKQRVDRVARRAGNVGDDGALLAQQRVEERGLADVGLADERQREFRSRLGGAGLRREPIDDRVEQIAGPLAVNRRDRKRFAETEPRELAVHGRQGARRLGFVGDQQDRVFRAAENHRDVEVDRVETVLRVDDEHDHVGVAGRVLRLLARAERDRVVGIDVELDAAGIDAGERSAAPLREGVQPVAGHAGRVLDDREPLADQAVEEGALPDVGATDDGDGGGANAQVGYVGQRDLDAVEGEFGHEDLVGSCGDDPPPGETARERWRPSISRRTAAR